MAFDTDLGRLRHLPETPLRALKWSFWWFRKTFFSKPKPENPAVVVPMGEEEAERFSANTSSSRAGRCPTTITTKS